MSEINSINTNNTVENGTVRRISSVSLIHGATAVAAFKKNVNQSLSRRLSMGNNHRPAPLITSRHSNTKSSTKLISAVFGNAAAASFNNLADRKSKNRTFTPFINPTTRRVAKVPNDQRTTERIIQNYLLIWLDTPSAHQKNELHQKSLASLQRIVNTIQQITDPDKCIEYLEKVDNEQVFLILPHSMAKSFLPRIHDHIQLHSIFILSDNRFEDQGWTEQWPKVRLICSDIPSMCDLLQQLTQQCDKDFIRFTSIPSSDIDATQGNLAQIDHPFLYTQLLKEILLDMDDGNGDFFGELTTYCQILYMKNHEQLKNIAKFSREYRIHTPVWWYEQAGFLKSMISRALSHLEMDSILRMRCFIRDLHQDLKESHAEQLNDDRSQLFTVYRGQTLHKSQIDQLLQHKGGLLSFTHFLSTTKSKDQAIEATHKTIKHSDLVDVLFVITIDPSNTSASFIYFNNKNTGKESTEDVLISINAVFRIEKVEIMNAPVQLHQVTLSVINTQQDTQLHSINKSIRTVVEGSTSWHRLCKLLVHLEEFDMAEQVYQAIIDQTSDDEQKAHLYRNIGHLQKQQGNLAQTVSSYDKVLVMRQRILSPNHPDLAVSFKDVGDVYIAMHEYTKAVWYYEKAYGIEQNILSAQDVSLAVTCDKLGLICSKISQHTKALQFYERALAIRQDAAASSNQADIARSLQNIAFVHKVLSDYPKAISFYTKALDIHEKLVNQDPQDSITLYSNLGAVYDRLGKYAKALLFHNKALEVNEKILPENHPSLIPFYRNTGLAHHRLTQYSKALEFYEKALGILLQSSSPQQSTLIEFYDRMGSANDHLNQYSKAIEWYEKALQIRQETLPPNHPELARWFNNIGSVYYEVSDYQKALAYQERAVDIGQSALSATHPDLHLYKKCVEITKRQLVLIERQES